MKQYTFKDGFKCVASTKEEAIKKHKIIANYKNKCSLSVSAQKELKAQGFKFKPSHDNEGESYDAYRTLKNGNEEWIACISPHEYVYKKYKNQYDLSIGRNSLVSKEFKDEKELLSFIVNKTKTSTKKETINKHKVVASIPKNSISDSNIIKLKNMGFDFFNQNNGTCTVYKENEDGSIDWIAQDSNGFIYKSASNLQSLRAGKTKGQRCSNEKSLIDHITKLYSNKIVAFSNDRGLENYIENIRKVLFNFRNIIAQTEIMLENYDNKGQAAYIVTDVHMSEVDMSYHIQVINNKDKARDFIISIGSGFACNKIVFTVIDGNQSKNVSSIQLEIEKFVKEGL